MAIVFVWIPAILFWTFWACFVFIWFFGEMLEKISGEFNKRRIPQYAIHRHTKKFVEIKIDDDKVYADGAEGKVSAEDWPTYFKRASKREINEYKAQSL